jgi:hypothetical protein
MAVMREPQRPVVKRSKQGKSAPEKWIGGL